MHPFFAESEHTLWPFRFAPSGSANRSMDQRVTVWHQELGSLSHMGARQLCQAQHIPPPAPSLGAGGPISSESLGELMFHVPGLCRRESKSPIERICDVLVEP